MSLFADLKVCLGFHDNCGKMIKLSNNHQTAQRTSRGGDVFFLIFQDGMVISRDPMLTDMLYQVSETFSVCFSVSLSLSLCCCLSVCLSVCLSLSLCARRAFRAAEILDIFYIYFTRHIDDTSSEAYWDFEMYWRTG